MNAQAMQRDEFERRLGKLALREGMTVSTFALLQGADRAVLQTTVVREFEPGRIYAERAVNAQHESRER